MSKKIDNIIEELIDQYQEDDRYNRPWIIGFSGGKDSTVLLTLVWLALIKIKEDNPNAELKRQVYVVCNDTMVENPVIEEYLSDVLQTIQKAAKDFYKDGYPILSQATMVKSILYMITAKNDAEVERNKSRKYLQKNPNPELVFRKYYADNQDSDIIKIIYQYFTAIQETFTDKSGNSFWDNKEQHNKPTNVLQTTIGYEALLNILKQILLISKDKDLFDKQLYKNYLEKAKPIDIMDEKYTFTTKTKKMLTDDLSNLIFNETEK
jgi:hypothetical protein